MRRITSLGLMLMLCIGLSAQGSLQDEILANENAPQQPAVDVQELLVRLQQIGPQSGTIDEIFTVQERLALKAYYKNQNRSSLIDIIPTAGATETFAVNVGDRFYDPGGPGGGGTDGDPGNYPNCDCITLSTLDGATEIEFLDFWVFATFDWLRIYDSADTTGPILYDNSSGGINDGDNTLADMIASNGSALFTGTSGSLTFEFNATAVVNRAGWDVEILATSGGGGGGSIAYGVENVNGDYGNFDITMPNMFNNVSVTPIANFEGAGAIDPNDNGTAYVIDNVGDAYSLDIMTGVYTSLGNVGLADITGLEYNPVDGTLYAITQTDLYTVDLGGLSTTAVGSTGMGLAIALAIDGAGNGWSYDLIDDQLYSVDLGTGAAAAVGPIGFDANFGQGMFYDENSDTVYMSAFNNGIFESEFRSVDTATGATTLIGGILPGTLAQVAWSSMPNSPVADNDECTTATAIACGETLSGDTSNNTDQGGANASPDEWFSFTGSGSPQVVTVSLCTGTSYDSFLSVYDACGGNQIASNDDSCGLQSELSFLSDGTTTYYIAVEGFGTNSGAFDIAVTCVDPPVNDECAGALPIECGVPIFGNTDTATPDSSPDCTGPGTTTGVWYVYEDTTGLVTDITIDTCGAGTDYDTQLSVYTGDCGSLTCVAGNDDDCGLQSQVSFQSDGNTTFYILVHGFSTSTGNFELNMTCTPVPPPNDMIVNSIDVDEIGVPYTDPAVAMPAATTEDGNPDGCNIDGANGVWYNFTAAASGTATAEIVSPAGSSFVVFFTAPDEMATEEDLEYFFQVGNQCAPGTSANITTIGGSVYYVFVVNTGGITDIVIDGELLSRADNTIEGFEFYPNPADETLNLTSVDSIENVAIYNLLGQEVLGQQVEATNTQLDLSSLATGAYLMKVTVDGQVGTYKVIKR